MLLVINDDLSEIHRIIDQLTQTRKQIVCAESLRAAQIAVKTGQVHGVIVYHGHPKYFMHRLVRYIIGELKEAPMLIIYEDTLKSEVESHLLDYGLKATSVARSSADRVAVVRDFIESIVEAK